MIVQILKERPVPVPQAGEPVLFKRRTPAQSDLGTVSSLDQAFDLIRMLDADGYPNAFLRVGRLRLEFTRASRKDGCVLADVKIAILPSEEPAAND